MPRPTHPQYRPGQDIAIAIDPAASSFGEGGMYDLSRVGQGRPDRATMLALCGRWIDAYRHWPRGLHT